MPTCDTPASVHTGPVRPYTHGDRCDSHRPGRGGGRCLPAGDRMTTPAAVFAQPAAGFVRPPLEGIAGMLASSVIDTVKQAAASAPRSRQSAVGPSGVGTPCIRRLGYEILDWPAKPNSDTDPWASIIGTAVHAWMAGTYSDVNTRLGRVRYLVERRVPIPGMKYGGSTDLYDRDWQLNNDWKVTSPANIRKYQKNGPGDQYRVQAHTYGLGLMVMGETPEHVAITFLPRGGRIGDLHVWAEPFDPQVAVDALNRYQTVQAALVALDPEAAPGNWALFPTGDAYCTYCPFYLPGSADLSKGCPGHKAGRTASKEK